MKNKMVECIVETNPFQGLILTMNSAFRFWYLWNHELPGGVGRTTKNNIIPSIALSENGANPKII